MARFDSLKELSKEELLALREELEKDIDYSKEKLEQNHLRGDDEKETRNDISFNNDSIKAIDEILEGRENPKKK